MDIPDLHSTMERSQLKKKIVGIRKPNLKMSTTETTERWKKKNFIRQHKGETMFDMKKDSSEKDQAPGLSFMEQAKHKILQVVTNLSKGVRADLEKSNLLKISVDVAEELRVSGFKVLNILKSGAGDIFWDVKASSGEAKKELRRALGAAKKKLTDQWPAISPDQNTVSKNAS